MEAGYELYKIQQNGDILKTKYDVDLLSGFDSDNLVCIHPDNKPAPCLTD
jgi:hypothetical protein